MVTREGQSGKELYIETWINAPLREIWPFIVDAEMISKSVGLPPVVYEEIPDPRGGSVKIGNTLFLGVKTRYVDKPHEWLQYHYASNERIYSKGLLKRLDLRLDCEDHGNSCLLRVTSQVEARHAWMQPIIRLLIDIIVKKMALKNKELEKFRSGEIKIPFPTKSYKPLSEMVDKWNETFERFALFSTNDKLNRKITEFILDSPDSEVAKIRPYALAKKLGEDRRDILVFMLRGTFAGVFDMNWDILCPSCRGAKHSSHHLRDLQKNVHCSSCNIDYESDFDRSVELTFTPHPTIRPAKQEMYCIGSPAKSLHVIAQMRLQAGETREIAVELEDGMYQVYSFQDNRKYWLEVANDDQPHDEATVELLFRDHRQAPNHIKIKPGTIKFRMINRDQEGEDEILVKLERAAWLENIVTAAEVTTMHEFRRQFSSEVLKPGMEIGVKNITLLFTDLKDSTQFYNNVGDAVAFSVVHDHFSVLEDSVAGNEGAVVKTIGDSVMAVFCSPSNALAAAFDIQRRIRELNENLPAERYIIVKSGLHSGSVLAVNLNDRLDYFGHTVNMAARTSGQSSGGDIVVTEYLYDQPAVQEYLNGKKISVENVETVLKGFPEQCKLYRIRPEPY